jgi:hypothetical protein
MKLKLHRKYLKENYTIGHLYEMVNGVERFIFDVIEDKVRDLNKDGDLNDVGESKVYAQTAIPYGTYEILLTVSPRFQNYPWAIPYKGVVPLLNNVPHFSGIRIHPGSSEKSSSGCLIVGLNTERGKVTESVRMYNKLMRDYLLPAKNRGEKITIEIV